MKSRIVTLLLLHFFKGAESHGSQADSRVAWMISESRASLKDWVARFFCYGKISPFHKKWSLLLFLL